MTVEEIRKSVAAETALIGETLRIIQTGQPGDLAGFDSRVAELCLATKALPLADAQALLPDFEQLAAALDALRGHVTKNMEAEASSAAKP
jgi:hypothetical protein